MVKKFVPQGKSIKKDTNDFMMGLRVAQFAETSQKNFLLLNLPIFYFPRNF